MKTLKNSIKNFVTNYSEWATNHYSNILLTLLILLCISFIILTIDLYVGLPTLRHTIWNIDVILVMYIIFNCGVSIHFYKKRKNADKN